MSTGGFNMKRTSTPARMRFEVFKRDRFACQYCGAKAPDVVLQADHIHPVAMGGETTILNLITSCAACNGGKGAVPLSDNAAIGLQRDQLAELEARREQIEMMLEWSKALQNAQDDELEALVSRVEARSEYDVTESGRASLRRLLKRYALAELLQAVNESFDIYARYQDDGSITVGSWETSFSKIGGVASILRQQQEQPYLKQLLYIQGILRNRSKIRKLDWLDYLEHAHLAGIALEDLEQRAKRVWDLQEDFAKPIDARLLSLGKPF